MRRYAWRVGLQLFFLVLPLVALVPSAGAITLRATPSLGLTGSWDSNILSATADNEVSDFIFRVNPSLVLSTDIYSSTINLVGGLEADIYADNPDLNTSSATVNYGLNVAKPLEVTSRLTVQPEARYLKANNVYYRNRMVFESAGTVLSSQSVLVSRSRVKEYSAGLRANYALYRTVSLGLLVSGTRQEFGLPALTGVKILQWEMTVTDQTSPRSFWGGFADGSYNSFDGGGITDVFGGGLTWIHEIRPPFTVSGRAGAAYWRRRPDAVLTNGKEKWAPTGRASIAYDRDDFHATLGGSYEIEGIGGFTMVTETGMGFLSLTDRFAPNWIWDLFGSYRKNKSVFPENAVGLDTTESRGGIRYQVSPRASLYLSGSYTVQSSSGAIGEDIKRAVIYLGLNLSNTYTIF